MTVSHSSPLDISPIPGQTLRPIQRAVLPSCQRARLTVRSNVQAGPSEFLLVDPPVAGQDDAGRRPGPVRQRLELQQDGGDVDGLRGQRKTVRGDGRLHEVVRRHADRRQRGFLGDEVVGAAKAVRGGVDDDPGGVGHLVAAGVDPFELGADQPLGQRWGTPEIRPAQVGRVIGGLQGIQPPSGAVLAERG